MAASNSSNLCTGFCANLKYASSFSGSGFPVQFPPGMNPAVVWSMMPFIIFLNTIVVVAFAVNKRLQVTANYFVAALACGDLVVACAVMPLILTFHALGKQFTLFSLFNTLLLICGCTYDRHVAVSYPLLYGEIVTKRKVFKIIAACWIVPSILPIIPEIWKQKENFVITIPHRTFMGTIAVFVLVAIFVQAAVYIRIFIIARKHVRAMCKLDRFTEDSQYKKAKASMKKFIREVRFAKLFALIGLNFFIFWIPVGYINFVDDTLLRNDLMPPWVFRMSFYTMWLTSLINPILYALFTKAFRLTILHWIIRLPCCGALRYKHQAALIYARQPSAAYKLSIQSTNPVFKAL